MWGRSAAGRSGHAITSLPVITSYSIHYTKLYEAIPFFGTKGFAATSTREIAAAAGTNVASIAYHFGGKDGLRLACAREFAARVQSIVIDSLPTDEPASAEAATAILHASYNFV